jgi:hypothetical protein
VTIQRRRWVALPVLAAVAVVAGCDREVAGTARPASTPRPTTTTTTTAPPATAADGTNYAACATRTCEIGVSGPVNIRIGGSAPGTLAISSVSADSVVFTLTLDDGQSANGTLKPGCDATTLGGGGMSGTFGSPDTDCAATPPTAVPGAVTFEMPAASGRVAIIWIAID